MPGDTVFLITEDVNVTAVAEINARQGDALKAQLFTDDFILGSIHI
jgi:hypothetical protein